MSNRNGGKWIRPEKRRRIYKRDRHCCVWCSVRVGDDATLDHVVPRVEGGSNAAHNLITACRVCNSSRRQQSAPAYALALAYDLIGEDASHARILRRFYGIMDRVVRAMGSELPR